MLAMPRGNGNLENMSAGGTMNNMIKLSDEAPSNRGHHGFEVVPLEPSFLRAPLAHRGLHQISEGRPENSRGSIQAAINAGYGVEIDLQASRENVPMLFHDPSLKRLTGRRGAVKDFSSKELQDIPLKHSHETIPTFAEILQLVDGKVPLLIEIKDQSGNLGPLNGALEMAVCAQISNYRGQVAFMSFNPHSIEKCAHLCPQIARGLVTGPFRNFHTPYQRRKELRQIPDYDRLGCSFISHSKRDLARPVVTSIRRKGGNILCWTIKSPKEEAKACPHVDNMTFEKYRPENY